MAHLVDSGYCLLPYLRRPSRKSVGLWLKVSQTSINVTSAGKPVVVTLCKQSDLLLVMQGYSSLYTIHVCSSAFLGYILL